MNIELWLAFLAASSVMLLIPGPTILTVIAFASSLGKRAALPLVAAVSFGDLTVICLSVLGLGSLLAISSTAFVIVKIGGGLYLIYLGIGLIKSANAPEQQVNKTLIKPHRDVFFNTWLVTALNPKGILFFSAFLPQFIQPDNPVIPQLLILSASFVCLAAVNTLFYVLLAIRAKGLIDSPSVKRRFDLSGGLAMSAAGIWSLTAKQSG